MSTGADMVAKVRARLADGTDMHFDSADLIRWLNEGAEEFAATTGCVQDKTNITTDGATYQWTITSVLTNPITIYDVRYAGIPLDFCPVDEVKYKYGASAGTPTAWTFWANTLEVDLQPTALSAGLSVFYTRYPLAMTSEASTFDFRVKWEYAIVAYAVYRAHDSAREGTLADRARAEFYNASAAAQKIINAQIAFGGFANG